MARLRSTAVVAAAMLLAVGLSGHAQQGGNPQPSTAQPAPPAAGPPPAPEQQPPVFRAGVNFVRVDVIVSDSKGNAVIDLAPTDFEIVENRTPQTIETFKLISLDGGLTSSIDQAPRQIRTDDDEESEAARDDVRLFAIFLDDYHVRRESSIGTRQQLASFIQTQLGPSDMIGLMMPLQPTASVRMTRNHEAIARAINQFQGRKYDYTPLNAAEQRYVYYPAETVERIRNQVSMSAIKALILRMGALKEGRKALLLVSEGYNSMLPPQMRDPVAAAPGLGNPSRNDPTAGDSPLEDRAAFSANADMESDLRAIWDLANRNNVAIYAIDPRGLATNEFGIDQNINTRTDRNYLNSTMQTLRTLAINTDGRAIVNRNDITMAMKQIVRDQSAYYLLGYNSTFTATDGKFHEISVKVKRPGVQVRARKGYWAFTAQDAARATAPPKPALPSAYASALAAIAAPARSRVVRTWIGTERGDAGKTRVTFVWEAVPHTPGAPVRPDDVPARVSLMAVGADGTPYFRGRAPATPSAAVPGAKVTFDVPPGTVQLRATVENANNDVLDTETRELEVPDLTLPRTTIGTPSVFHSRVLREYQELKANLQATPSASREFSRAERVFFRLPVYAEGDQAPPLKARLLNRGGDPLADLPVTPAAGNPSIREVELTLQPYAPGEYLVEMEVPGTDDSQKQIVGFRLTS